jgi:hypothetical protein
MSSAIRQRVTKKIARIRVTIACPEILVKKSEEKAAGWTIRKPASH